LVSRKITGLVLQAIIGFIMSGLYAQLKKHIGAFAVIYGIFLTFGEFGPGNCLGLLASKTGPTAVRGQFYGIAAAIGKVGAFAGTWCTSYFRLDLSPILTELGHV
jgi:Sugar (and other) transporter